MYKQIDKLQHSFLDFNQPLGLKMNPENRWVKMADLIPWDEFERKYAERSGLYKEHADVRVRNDALPDDAVEAIVRGFNNEIACD